MIKACNLPNVGYVKARITNELKNKLIANFNTNLPILNTSLEDEFIPIHYKLTDNDCLNELSHVLSDCFKVFDNEYPEYIIDVKKTLTYDIYSKLHLELDINQCWYNHQKQNLFTPLHHHSGIFSFVAWLKLPNEIVNETRSGAFSFVYQDCLGKIQNYFFQCKPENEGDLLFFPSQLSHSTFPINGIEKTRLTLSGNLVTKFTDANT